MKSFQVVARAMVFGLAFLGAACESTGGGATDEAGALSVEASCGQCNFDMPGDGCDLAVRIDGETYFVDGSHTDDHGDAHAPDGLCNAIRQAEVEGQVEEGRFVATSFVLVP